MSRRLPDPHRRRAGPAYDWATAVRAPAPDLRSRHDTLCVNRLAVVPLVYEPLLVAIPVAHPLAQRPTLTASDVATQPWISVHAGFPLKGTMPAIAATARRPLTITHRVNDFFVAASVVASGAALALLPAYTTRPEPGVVLRPLTFLHAGRHIDALARPEALARMAVKTVADTLHTIAQDQATSPHPTGGPPRPTDRDDRGDEQRAVTSGPAPGP